jgi:hypothetical protein
MRTNLPPFHNIRILFYITLHGFEVAAQFWDPTFLNVVESNDSRCLSNSERVIEGSESDVMEVVATMDECCNIPPSISLYYQPYCNC